MNDNYQKLFRIQHSETPSDLLKQRIVREIARLEQRALSLRRIVFGSTIAVSLLGLYPSLSYALSELAQSSFAQYLSLLASDGDIALANMNEFFYSLAESFPIVGATLVLSCFLVFFIALDRMFGKSVSHTHYSSHRYT